MANCHDLFSSFNNAIKLTEPRKEALRIARNSLRERINAGFNLLPQPIQNGHKLSFQTQGSFIMDTIINPTNEDYDLDDGVYFLGNLTRSQRPSTSDFHKGVIRSIENGSNNFIENVKDKETCVRVHYRSGYTALLESGRHESMTGSFHVDLPIYYSTVIKSPDLADTKRDWIVSDPIEFIEWFENKVNSNFNKNFLYEKTVFGAQYNLWRDQIRQDDAQLRRIVRYLKAWCDNNKNEMPCGIIVTILAANNYSANQRDDISLRDTLINIKTALDKEFVCRRPTTPKDEDLFASTTQAHKTYFINSLNSFVDSAKQACEIPVERDGCLKWQRHLGNRFPCHLASTNVESANRYSQPAVIGGSATSA